MARRCIFCEKMPVVAHKVSHSNIKTKVRAFPNLQKVRLNLNGVNQRGYVCTRCLRTGLAAKPKVRKYVAPEAAPADVTT